MMVKVSRNVSFVFQQEGAMVEIKEMSDYEKFAAVQDNIIFSISFAADFVRRHLGEDADLELQASWRQDEEQIPDAASARRKYEIAYGNWIRMAKISFDFIKQRMGGRGLTMLELEEADALKKHNRTPALAIYRLMRLISPHYAFQLASRQLAYQLQWLTPFTVTELSGDKLVLDIPQCKILEYPDTQDICQIGCQKVYPRWLADQFMVNMAFKRPDHHCTCTVTPL
jgi:hypothetical protein